MISQNEILQATHKGYYIYKRVLSYYYEDSLSLGLSGKQCLPASNPFNEGKPTLRISLKDDVFCYQDYEIPDFHGNPLDFAALHYQLTGDELLEKINQDMNLNLGEDERVRNGESEKIKPILPLFILEIPCFSFYRCPITNTTPERQVTLLETYLLIKSDEYKERTLKLRSIGDPEAASQYKKNEFDSVTISGMFSSRKNSALVHHSGLIVLDFDHVENLPLAKNALVKDPDLLLDMIFDSPSGHGFKAVISIDVFKYSHHRWFESATIYLKNKYNLEVDQSGKDVARACFLPHDPKVWINPIYLI